MRILFAGTPEMAVPSLRRLAADHNLVGVLTAPDRRKGRGRSFVPSPVKAAALDLNLEIVQPSRLNTEARELVSSLAPELLVVVAYGRIFGPKFLDLFDQGGINLHPSLLPRHRGPSPIPAAILAGDPETGITVQRLALEMDSGNILAQTRIPLDGTETTASLTERVASDGAELLSRAVEDLEAGRVEERVQDPDAASYCGLIAKNDGEIDWTQSAVQIERMSRAYNPWPGAFTFFKEQKLTLWKTAVYPRSADAAGDAAAGAAAESSAP
ncbi:MAG: methionyl-tRNA formyltransferase, partial [Spirochaetes bacterium]|nr:methionyl-tRNA formyltransferase [Spirochaetota bacterium]